MTLPLTAKREDDQGIAGLSRQMPTTSSLPQYVDNNNDYRDASEPSQEKRSLTHQYSATGCQKQKLVMGCFNRISNERACQSVSI
jgi:hypothetical protein